MNIGGMFITIARGFWTAIAGAFLGAFIGFLLGIFLIRDHAGLGGLGFAAVGAIVGATLFLRTVKKHRPPGA